MGSGVSCDMTEPSTDYRESAPRRMFGTAVILGAFAYLLLIEFGRALRDLRKIIFGRSSTGGAR